MKHIIQTIEELENTLMSIFNSQVISIDTETTGLMFDDGFVCGWCIGDIENQYYVPVRHTPFSLTASMGMENLDPLEVADRVKYFVENYQGEIIFHNAKFDFDMMAKDWWRDCSKHERALQCYWFWRDRKFHDTYLMAHLLDENRLNGLKPLTDKLLNLGTVERDLVKEKLKAIKTLQLKYYKDNFLLGKKGNKKIWAPSMEAQMDLWKKHYTVNYAHVEIPVMGEYGADDVFKTLHLFCALYPTVRDAKEISNVYALEKSLVPVVSSMELEGIAVDVPFLKELRDKLTFEVGEKEVEIKKTFGDFDIASTKDFAKKLTDLGCKLFKTDKGNPQVSEPVLKGNFEKFPPQAQQLIEMVFAFRKASKLLHTYVDKFVRKNLQGDIHCSFNTCGTVTGRMSSSSPSLQTIPKRKDLRVRRGFVSRKGFKFYCFDYDQMEMRLAAHFSGDKTLIDIITTGQDPYKYLAGFAEEIKYDAVPKYMRDNYKTIWLMTQYGAGAQRISKFSNKAKEIKDLFEQAFPEYGAFSKNVEQAVYQWGFVPVLYGRRRRMMASEAYKAVNAKIQGGGAMMIKKVMAERVGPYLMNPEAPKLSRMLLQVHDELVFEIADSEAAEVVPEIKRMMEDFKTVVPMTVGVEVGNNWADKEEVEMVGRKNLDLLQRNLSL